MSSLASSPNGSLPASTQGLAPVLDDVAEGALAGAIAEKTLVILQLDIVAVDNDRRQAGGAMRYGGRHRGLVGHYMVSSTAGRAVGGQPGISWKVSPCDQDEEGEATIRRTISIARRINVSEASRVR